MKYLTINSPGVKEYDYVDLAGDDIKVEYALPPYHVVTFKPGTNVRLAKRAEQFYSIIADGKELITKDSKGTLIVPELNDGNVKMAFKPDVTVFFDTFFGCTSLTSIPEDLFANNPNVVSFGYTLAELWSDLWRFENDPDFNGNTSWDFGFPVLFGECGSLTAIPEKLFANNTEVRHFGMVFASCTGITSIPEKLFANNTKVRYFGRMPENPSDFGYALALLSVFFGCGGITSIPEKLFANNPNVTDFAFVFSGCASLQSIPAGLFDNNRKATVFESTFGVCESLTGESPYTMIGDKKVHLYERSNYPDQFATPIMYSKCFYSCTGLSDYAQIPSGWK